MTEPGLLEVMGAARTAVTGGRGGQFVQAVLDERNGWERLESVERALHELRRRLAAAVPIGDERVLLAADWVDTGARTVLLLTMGAPS